jgi:hypothetical protein
MKDPLQSEAFNQQMAFIEAQKAQQMQQGDTNKRMHGYEQEEKQLEDVLWEAEQVRLGNLHLIVNRQMQNYEAKLAENSPRSLLEKARSFVEAMVSAVKDTAPTKEVYDARINICIECPAFEIAIKNPKQIGHCKACGCGKNPMSALAVKAGIAKSSCPKKLWPVDVTIDPAAVALPIAPPPQ